MDGAPGALDPSRGEEKGVTIMARRFKEKIVDGQVLYDNIARQLADMPRLAADHQALGDALAQARDLEAKQEMTKGALRDINDRRLRLEERTDDLRRRLVAGLQSILGPDSARLLEFGVRPRPTTHRRSSLTPAQKAARAAERAIAKAAALAAAEAAAAAVEPAPEPPAS